ncbi:zinc ABC transporter substrate-binding protein [Pseudooceanicola nanhaiensis]|uniref:zinc ABC transporter substrate-binding protein n=1 Tax=Pseudooceanicola nanhaiensis TaxID=375761 RepID=UPI0035124C32
MRTVLTASLIAFAAPAAADVPNVVTDIAPVHSLVASVMEGVGEPYLLIEPGVSPHHYALKPSEARKISNADVVFWIGEEDTPWLGETVETLAPDAMSVEMLDLEGSILLPVREGGNFAPHDHGGEGHDHVDGHDEHDHVDGHDDHDHADGHGDHDHADGHDDHAQAAGHDDHDHAAHGTDPHAWLDPRNAQTWLRAIAEILAEADPENAVAYRANAERTAEELGTLDVTIAVRLKDTPRGFITFHDAYQYFENRFDIRARGALSASDAVEPGPARVAALREMVQREGVSCLFAEPQFNPRQVATLAEDLNLRTGTLDPIGAQLEPGPALYGRLVTGIADALMVCLNGE